MEAINWKQLSEAAAAVRQHAYAPYSKFSVGAALLGVSGKVYTGCNVENLSFGLSICAERNAVFQGIAAGESKFLAIAVVSDSGEPVSPCGACRQVLAEFGDLQWLSENLDGESYRSSISELLPRSSEGILDK